MSAVGPRNVLIDLPNEIRTVRHSGFRPVSYGEARAVLLGCAAVQHLQITPAPVGPLMAAAEIKREADARTAQRLGLPVSRLEDYRTLRNARLSKTQAIASILRGDGGK